MRGLPDRSTAILLMLLGACGGSPGGSAGSSSGSKKHPSAHARADASVADAGGADPSDASPADAATAWEAGPPAYATNTSFETAETIEPGMLGVWPKRYDPLQADYYRFEARAGGFYVLTTEFNDFSPDNLIELYDADQNLIALNADGSMWPGDNVDARLVVRIERAGTYFARVANQEALPDDLFAGNIPLPYYHFSLLAVDRDTPGYALEDDSSDTSPVTFTTDAATNYQVVTLLGDLSLDDHDVFAFMGRTNQVLVGEILANGPHGNGSSASFARLQVANADQHVLARITGDKGQRSIHPPVSDGAYQLMIDNQAEPGANPFYAIDLVMLPENPSASADDHNDQLATAEPLAMKGSLSRRGLILARLPPADIDYYSFDAGQNEHLSIVCEAESGGSGIRGLHAEVRDDQDVVLSTADETSDTNLIIQRVQLLAAGTHYLRLSSATAMESDMVEPWFRCAVLIGP